VGVLRADRWAGDRPQSPRGNSQDRPDDHPEAPHRRASDAVEHADGHALSGRCLLRQSQDFGSPVGCRSGICPVSICCYPFSLICCIKDGTLLRYNRDHCAAKSSTQEAPMNASRFTLFVVLGGVVSLTLGSPVLADVKPHVLFSDGMVLQQGIKVPVWG